MERNINTNTQDTVTTYFQKMLNLNIKQLSNNYNLVETQTKRCFVLTVSAGIIGFLIIASGIIGIYNSYINIDFGIVATTSGTLLEFITGFFFYLYNKTIRQLRDYHNDLIDNQNTLLAFKIIEDTELGEDQIMMKHKFLEIVTGMRPNYKTDK